MKYTKELEKKQVKFVIELDAEEWEHELNHVYEHQKNKFKVEGFRTGKAPRKVIEKQYGEAIFYNDAIDEAFYHSMNEIFEKDAEKVVGNPKIDIKKLDKSGLTMEAIFELYPEVKLGEYKNLKLEKPAVKVSAKEVDDRLNQMVEKSARMVSVDREVKNGDIANIDFTGYKDGKAFDGGHAEKYDLAIGSGTFIPGFEEQIVGMKKGEERDVNVTFPEDYPAENLKGSAVVFKIVLHDIKEKQLPEVNDKFAQNVSEYDTLEEYKNSLKEEIKKEKEFQADQEYTEKLLEAVVGNAQVEISEAMVDEQADMFIHDFEHRLSHQGLKLEDYLKYMNTTVEELKKSRLDDARKTCKTRLVMEAIVEKEHLEVTEKDFDDFMARQALKMGTTVEEIKKGYDEHALSHVANDLLVNKFFDFLKENNK